MSQRALLLPEVRHQMTTPITAALTRYSVLARDDADHTRRTLDRIAPDRAPHRLARVALAIREEGDDGA